MTSRIVQVAFGPINVPGQYVEAPGSGLIFAASSDFCNVPENKISGNIARGESNE